MTTLAASAFDLQDCLFPGCPREATNGDGMCRDHHGRTPPAPGSVTATHDSNGRLVPGALAHLMDDEQPEAPAADLAVRQLVDDSVIRPDQDDDLVVDEPTKEEEPVTQRVWDRDNIIEAVQAFHAKHGRTPRQPELRTANGLPSQGAITASFGNMTDCFKEAGFEPTPRAPRARPAAAPTAVKPPPVEKPAEPVAPPAANGKPTDLETIVAQIQAKREELLDLQASALVLLAEIREAIEA